MAGEEPPYLTVGTEVSAKYKGAFCEAKIKKVVRQVKCKVTLKEGNVSVMVTDEHIKGPLRPGASVEVRNPTTLQTVEATIISMKDSSSYTAIFDDGDEAVLRRTQMCLKGEKHFVESETLDQLPLTHPEHFGTPVMQNRKKTGTSSSSKRKPHTTPSNDESSSSEEEEDIQVKKRVYKGKLIDMIGKVVVFEVSDKRGKGSSWVPGLIVIPSASDLDLKTREHLLIRSFKDSRYVSVLRKDTRELVREEAIKNEDKTLKVAMEKAVHYLDEGLVPSAWNRADLLGSDTEEEEEDTLTSSDEDTQQERDRFVAQLYKFMDDRATPINKTPQIGQNDIDLYRMFRLVRDMGGFNKVTNQMKWRHVYHRMGLPATNTASHQIKSAYKKYLHAFEDFYRKLGNSMGTLSGRPSRPSRNGGHSSRSILSFRERESPNKSPRKPDHYTKKEEVVKDDDNESTTSDASSVSRDSPRRGRPKLHLSPARDSTSDKKATKEEEKKALDSAPRRTPKPTEKKLELKKEEERKEERRAAVKEEKAKEKLISKPDKKFTRSTSVVESVLVEKDKPAANEDTPAKTLRRRSTRAYDGDPFAEEIYSKPLPATPPEASKQRDNKEISKAAGPTPKDTPKSIIAKESIAKTPAKGTNTKEVISPKQEVKEVKKEVMKKEEGKNSKAESDDESVDDAASERAESEVDRSEKEFKIHRDDGEYRVGTKLRVKYGRGKSQKIYEAKICESQLQNGVRQYLVHYAGWNTRYDEWVRKERIVGYFDSPGAKKVSPKPESPPVSSPPTKPPVQDKSPDPQVKKRGRPSVDTKPEPTPKKPAVPEPMPKKTTVVESSAKKITPSESSTKKPTTSEPLTKKITPSEASTTKPTTSEPSTKKITPSEASTKKPTISESSTKKITPSEASTKKPTISESSTKKITPSEASIKKPTTSEPSTKKITPSEPSTKKITTSESSTSTIKKPALSESSTSTKKVTASESAAKKLPVPEPMRRPRSKSPAQSTPPSKPRPTRSSSIDTHLAIGLPPKTKRTRRNSGHTDTSEQISGVDSDSDVSVDERLEEEQMKTNDPSATQSKPVVEPAKSTKSKPAVESKTEQATKVKEEKQSAKADKKETKSDVKTPEQLLKEEIKIPQLKLEKVDSDSETLSKELKAMKEAKLTVDKTAAKESPVAAKDSKQPAKEKSTLTKDKESESIVKEDPAETPVIEKEIEPPVVEATTNEKEEKEAEEPEKEKETKPEVKPLKKGSKGRPAMKKDDVPKREPSERKRQLSESKQSKEEPEKAKDEVQTEKEYSHEDPLLDIATRGVEKEIQEEKNKEEKETKKRKGKNAGDKKASVMLEKRLKKDSPEKPKEDKESEKKKGQKKVKKKKKDEIEKIDIKDNVQDDGEKDPYEFGDSESVEEPIKLEHVERREPVKFDRNFDNFNKTEEVNEEPVAEESFRAEPSRSDKPIAKSPVPTSSRMNKPPSNAGNDDYRDIGIDALLSAAVMDNTPPTTPDASPRRHHPEMSPLPEETFSTTRSDYEANIEVERFMNARRAHPAGDESPNACDASTTSNSSGGSSGNAPSSESSLDHPSNNKRKQSESPPPVPTTKRRKRGHKRGPKPKAKEAKGGSDSDEAADTSAAISSTSLNISPLKRTSYEPRPRSPNSYKYNFHLEEGNHLNGEARIQFIQNKMQEIRKTYLGLKSEVASIDRKRKRARRREREAAQAIMQVHQSPGMEVDCS